MPGTRTHTGVNFIEAWEFKLEADLSATECSWDTVGMHLSASLQLEELLLLPRPPGGVLTVTCCSFSEVLVNMTQEKVSSSAIVITCTIRLSSTRHTKPVVYQHYRYIAICMRTEPGAASYPTIEPYIS